MKNTITEQQATTRVEDYAKQVVAALPAQARPEKFSANTNQCDDPTDNGPKGRVIASFEYEIHDLPREQYNNYFDALRKWWTDHDFRVLTDDRPKDMYIWVENNQDGFRMALQANDLGKLYLTATSPCVWPKGTPAPGATG
ncbi:hypothetical protein F0L68_00200 [Solihabitans fulvus]|uniref:Uncharacterized protein n=1 Tax=Solihabitans fulvus TaxID=1892852 RepID=A0A5B2XU16_9PSEU|nr:hypothetical protein [Solihabitans fulvus]KAA2266996.1 hypothetical protein F0L68_00200 [Solihabitans fulvus]